MNNFTKLIKGVDIFGKRVYLTHERKEMHKTTLGGIFSIGFFVFILAYGIILCLDVWTE